MLFIKTKSVIRFGLNLIAFFWENKFWSKGFCLFKIHQSIRYDYTHITYLNLTGSSTIKANAS